MAQFSTNLVIHRPVEDVFTFVSNYENSTLSKAHTSQQFEGDLRRLQTLLEKQAPAAN